MSTSLSPPILATSLLPEASRDHQSSQTLLSLPGRNSVILPGLTLTPTPNYGLAFPQAKGCTTTLTENIVSPCSWDETQTVYPSTTTLYKRVDCHGCDNIYVKKDIYFCPNQRINHSERVAAPSTYWSTLCGLSTAADELVERGSPMSVTAGGPQVSGMSNPGPSPIITTLPTSTTAPDLNPREADRRSPQVDQAVAACPTTYVVQPQQSAGKTLTRYSRYTTTTLFLNCGGCPLVISTALAGYGPPGIFTKTTTLPVGTQTAYACL
ncbi:hypothetical protein B0T26DRAFT_645896 [Lasiosphaeria miniovina]|uniref:Uncharacterized protein n=1 Tax=Lasiosphaeria miniovina TaxID=1954250 RepID=A0AA40DYQ5_9PEZI|nr:uncharacterized protein B0T26DRAFT_645896 [Lasiosphaeria miniovina]KAK0717861.1 hypothetical protein B0T26DRAFT_645896 [Lasiosphaeria miniovina]